jgi:hypothetical protein
MVEKRRDHVYEALIQAEEARQKARREATLVNSQTVTGLYRKGARK